MVDIRIPRKEFNWDFLYKLEDFCKEQEIRACVTIIDVIPVPIKQVTVKGELIVGEENDA